MSASRSFKADVDAVSYFKHLAEGFRFALALAIAALLFVFSQGAQKSFAPTAPDAFIISLLLLITGAALSLIGYLAATNFVSKLLRLKALNENWQFDYGWRQTLVLVLQFIATTVTVSGVCGLVIHYFFQWFMINQPALI